MNTRSQDEEGDWDGYYAGLYPESTPEARSAFITKYKPTRSKERMIATMNKAIKDLAKDDHAGIQEIRKEITQAFDQFLKDDPTRPIALNGVKASGGRLSTNEVRGIVIGYVNAICKDNSTTTAQENTPTEKPSEIKPFDLLNALNAAAKALNDEARKNLSPRKKSASPPDHDAPSDGTEKSDQPVETESNNQRSSSKENKPEKKTSIHHPKTAVGAIVTMAAGIWVFMESCFTGKKKEEDENKGKSSFLSNAAIAVLGLALTVGGAVVGYRAMTSARGENQGIWNWIAKGGPGGGKSA